jgi:hypothetical protein
MTEIKVEQLNLGKEVVESTNKVEKDIKFDGFSTLNIVGGAGSWVCPHCPF